MARTVGKRRVKAKTPVERKREVNLFDFSDDFGTFEDPFDDGDFLGAGHPNPARTTRDLTGVAVGVTMVGIIPPLISTL